MVGVERRLHDEALAGDDGVARFFERLRDDEAALRVGRVIHDGPGRNGPGAELFALFHAEAGGQHVVLHDDVQIHDGLMRRSKSPAADGQNRPSEGDALGDVARLGVRPPVADNSRLRVQRLVERNHF